MPKMKTNKSVAKRFRRSGSGKIMHSAANRRHNLGNKPTGHKRRLRREVSMISGNDAKRLSRMAPSL